MVKNNLDFEKILLDHIKHGKKPISITKIYNIPKQNLQYYLNKLKGKQLIRKLDKGVWEVVKTSPNHHSKKTFRGHAFIWKIKFNSIPKNWDKREEILKNNNIQFKKLKNTIRIKIKGKKIWLNNKGMTIYEPKSFIASTPLETRIKAIYELLSTINQIKSNLKMNFNYKFTTRREHIGKMKDLLAIELNKEGEKLRIIDNGEIWMEIDNSFNLDETEFYKTKSFSPVVNATGYNSYFNSHRRTNFKVTPEFILNTMNGIQQNQLIFDKNMKSHLNILNKLGKAVDNLTNAVKKKNIKESLKESQTTLGEF